MLTDKELLAANWELLKSMQPEGESYTLDLTLKGEMYLNDLVKAGAIIDTPAWWLDDMIGREKSMYRDVYNRWYAESIHNDIVQYFKDMAWKEFREDLTLDTSLDGTILVIHKARFKDEILSNSFDYVKANRIADLAAECRLCMLIHWSKQGMGNACDAFHSHLLKLEEFVVSPAFVRALAQPKNKELIGCLAVNDSDSYGEWLVGKLFVRPSGIYEMQLGLWQVDGSRYAYKITAGGKTLLEVAVNAINMLYASIVKAEFGVAEKANDYLVGHYMGDKEDMHSIISFLVANIIAPNWNETKGNQITFINNKDL